jgi:hypothetical protein
MRIQFVQDIIDKIRGKKNLKSNNVKYGRMIFSQDGEDAVLLSYIEEDKGKNYKGFYVDIGAHHPKRFSNTNIFYQMGWRGINIDGTPGSMREFNVQRIGDINIEAAISDNDSDVVSYYEFEESALNSFDKKIVESYIENGCRLNKIVKLKTSSINTVLDKYVPNNKKIDFITIDIEGVDEQVIRSLNYGKYAPDYFIIEDSKFNRNCDFAEYGNISNIYQFLSKKNYIVIGKTMRSIIYRKQARY